MADFAGGEMSPPPAPGRPAKVRKLAHESDPTDCLTGHDGCDPSGGVAESSTGVAAAVTATKTATESTVETEKAGSAGGDDSDRNIDGTAGLSDTNDDDHGRDRLRRSAAEVLEAAGVPLVDSEGKALTKSAMKRIRRKLDWDSKAEERRVRRRQEAKQKRERRRAEKKEAGEEGGSGVVGAAGAVPAARPPPVQVPITIIIDCAFNELMTERELKSLASQITRCYSDNNRIAPFRVHLAISSWSGTLRSRFENELDRQHESWKGVRFFEEDFVAVAEMSKKWMMEGEVEGGKIAGALADDFVVPASSVVAAEVAAKKLEDGDSAEGETVYFSSDSDRTLARLRPFGTYVIGGLVDRNRHKGVCHRRAVERGVATAQLPIGEFLKLSAVNVLATNHVNEIALRWLEMGNWADAFVRVMPKRKGGQLLDHLGRRGDGGDGGADGGAGGDGDGDVQSETEQQPL